MPCNCLLTVFFILYECSNVGNEINLIIVEDLHKFKVECPEFDGRAKALMSEQIHKQALDSVGHVHDEINDFKRLLSKKDKLDEDIDTDGHGAKSGPNLRKSYGRC
mmetsp:Transcript_2929/g.5960  ORF Transcript_2929/g.5960 Transcript_2929/m.5960 type:complete len:106 (+) Transcript_2929:721-1038(+)